MLYIPPPKKKTFYPKNVYSLEDNSVATQYTVCVRERTCKSNWGGELRGDRDVVQEMEAVETESYLGQILDCYSGEKIMFIHIVYTLYILFYFVIQKEAFWPKATGSFTGAEPP